MRPFVTQDPRLPRAPFAQREAEFGASSGTFLCLTKLNSMGDAIGIVAVRQINYLSANLRFFRFAQVKGPSGSPQQNL